MCEARLGTVGGEWILSALQRGPEPRWVAQLRRRSLDLFGKLAWPDSGEENWRFTDYRRLLPPQLLDRKTPGGATRNEIARIDFDLRALVPDAVAVWGGTEVHVRADGLLLREIHAALSDDSPDLRRLLVGMAEHARDRFDALSFATFGSGVTLDVAPGTELAAPVGIQLAPAGGARGWDSSLSVIRLGPETRGAIVLHFAPGQPQGDSWGMDRIHIEVGENSRWDFLFIQGLGADQNRLQRIRMRISEGAEVRVNRVDWGGATVKAEMSFSLQDSGSRLLVRGVYAAEGSQHLELDTLQDHLGPLNASDLLVKGVVAGSSTAVHRGHIWIHPEAGGSSAYQANRNLILSRGAHVHAIPMLDIQASDVRCSHASATGPVDRDQIFYIRSRGVSLREALRLIVAGFLSGNLAGAKPERLVRVVEESLAAKLDHLLPAEDEVLGETSISD